MFTGIIEGMGELATRRVRGKGAVLRIRWAGMSEPLALGESIAVDGVCLTATRSAAGWFEADCSPQTLRITTLGGLRPGIALNLERALAAGGRMGGHFVQGHVDAVGKVVSRRSEGDSRVVAFSRPAAITDLLVPRGSVTVNGVSLTISALHREDFEVTLIPHTLEVTNLKALQRGSSVNLEGDILGKYVRHFLAGGGPTPWTEEV